MKEGQIKLIILSDTRIKPGQLLPTRPTEDPISILKSSDIIIRSEDFETLVVSATLLKIWADVLVFGHFYHPIAENIDVYAPLEF